MMTRALSRQKHRDTDAETEEGKCRPPIYKHPNEQTNEERGPTGDPAGNRPAEQRMHTAPPQSVVISILVLLVNNVK